MCETPWGRWGCTVGGLAALWCSLQSSGFYPLSVAHMAAGADARAVAMCHLVYALAVVVCAVGVFALRGHVDAWLARWGRLAAVSASVLGLAGYALLLTSGGLPGVVAALGALLVAAFVVAATMLATRWTLGLSSARDALLATAVSFMAAQVIVALWAVASLPQAALLVGLVVVWAGCAYGLEGGLGTIAGPLARPFAGIPWGMVFPSLLLIYFSTIFVRLRIAAFTGDASDASKLLSALFGLLFMAAVWLLLWRCRLLEVASVSSFVLLSMVYLAALMALLLAGMAEGVLARRVLIAVEHCIEAFVWMALARSVYVRKTEPAVACALYLVAVVALPWMLSFDLYYLAGLDAVVNREVLTGPVLALMAFVTALVAVGFLLIRTAAVLRAEQERTPTMPGPDWERALVERACAPYGLTEREIDVAVYLYRGLSARRTADVLGVAEPTVKSYASKVYRRLGIHSKQELIEFVDACRIEP